MADNVAVTPGSGATIATDDVSGVQYQRVKVDGGGDGASVPILAGGGVEASAVRVTIANDSTGLVSIDDNGASVTVDAPVGTPVFVQLSDGAAPLTTLPISVAVGAATIAKAEDAPAANGDVGVPAMVVQEASPGNTVGADGDYTMLKSYLGRLWCSAEITASAGSIGKQEDSAFNNEDVGAAIMVVQNDTPANFAANGDYSPLQMEAGRLWTSAEIPVGATTIAKAEDVAHVSGDVGVPALSVRKDTAAATSGTDGDYQPLVTDANGRLHVVASSGIAGDVAHDAADSGNPVKVGGKATALFTLPTAVAANDRANLITDLYGRLIVVSRPDDIKRLGVYYYHSGVLTVAASADAAASSSGGRLWLVNPVGSAVTRRVRKITFRSQLGSALATPTSPRFTVEQATFTGTGSGGQISSVRRRAADDGAVGALRTAVTGMTVGSGTVVCSFFPVAGATAVGYSPACEASFEPGLEDYLDLAPGELLVVRQADNGTASDTRRVTFDFVVEEF